MSLLHRRRFASLVALGVFTLPFCLGVRPSFAGWNTNGNLLSFGTGTGSDGTEALARMILVPDGEAGAFAVWSSGAIVRVQRVTGTGEIASGWPADGVEVTDTSLGFPVRGSEIFPKAISDGAGGVIVGWYATRPWRAPGLYAQRITGSGVRVWSDSGRTVTESDPDGWDLASDGVGGAILAWNTGTGFELWGSRLDAQGAKPAGWPAALAPEAVHPIWPSVVADGQGGAIVAWAELRESPAWSIYALRVTPHGTPAAGWPASGTLLCVAPNDRYFQLAIADGLGGVLVSWSDYRVGNYDLYAQHIDQDGGLVPGWTTGGVVVSQGLGHQGIPASGPPYQALVTDGQGGALLAWMDTRGGGYDLYANHVTAAGNIAAGWLSEGNAMCTAPLQQMYPVLASDGGYGALLAWSDRRTGNDDVYLTHFNAAGDIEGSWPVNGKVICNAANHQSPSAICTDGGNGAFVAWRDFRRGDMAHSDIYAIRLTGDAALPIATVPDPEGAGLVIHRVRPNPAAGAVAIGFRLASDAQATLEWLDVHGRRVLERRLAGLGPGDHVVRVDPGSLPAGVYFVQLAQGEQRAVARMAYTR
jgi:hypothetical protein